MPTKSVELGDSDYTRLHARWVLEGSPNGNFEDTGEWGGRLWLVRYMDGASDPTFFLRAAAGPTDPGLDKVADWDWGAQSNGYEVEMQRMGLQFTEGPGGPGDMRIAMKDFPCDETV